MTIKELEKFLIKKGAPRDMYSLSGGLPNEAFCIERSGNKWHLYYSERGCKRTIGYFDSEDKVTSAFLSKVDRYI